MKNKALIIGMTYDNAGDRHISHILYDGNYMNSQIESRIKLIKEFSDEVYVIDFKENTEFIDEIVLRGCRV